MQSKVVKNLYFAGEILDIDAITGVQLTSGMDYPIYCRKVELGCNLKSNQATASVNQSKQERPSIESLSYNSVNKPLEFI